MLRITAVFALLIGPAFGQGGWIRGDAMLESFKGGIRLLVDADGDGLPDDFFVLSVRSGLEVGQDQRFRS